MNVAAGRDPTGEAPDPLWSRVRVAIDALPPEVTRPPATGRVGAVLVLVEDGPEGPRFVLTRRRRDLRSHPGQLAFPGGRVDAGEGIEAAALREATEEVGLDPASVEVVGRGPTFHVPPSRFWVVPVLARWRRPHPLAPDPSEVEAVVTVGLATLLEERRWRHTPIATRGGSAFAWQLDEDLLWGATAFIVRRVLDVVRPGWDGGRDPSDLGPERAVEPWRVAPRGPRRAALSGPRPTLAQASLPHVGPAEVRALRAHLAARGVGPEELARRSGERLAEAALLVAGRDAPGAVVPSGRATVLAGPSSDGAGGYAAAAVLARTGLEVIVLAAGPPRWPALVGDTRAAGARVLDAAAAALEAEPWPGDVVVDALLGIGARAPLEGDVERVARWLRRHDVAVVASQVPSGILADRGLAGTSLSADLTVALGLPLAALREPSAQAFLGDVHLADVGIALGDWETVGVTGVPGTLFSSGPLVRLEVEATEGDAGTPLQTSDELGTPVRAVGLEPTLGGV
ncbi:MAG: hypothetical protein RLZZ272_1287 [Actinomycetota bacterium]